MALTISVEDIISTTNNSLLHAKPHWTRVRLGDVATVLNGYAFKAELFNRTEGTPLIRIRDVGSDDSETLYSGEFESKYLVQPGELLIGMDGDFNCARWRGKPSLLNQRVCKVSISTDAYEDRFLDFVLPGYLKAINEATSSITVKHLSSRTIQDIPLPCPPIDEQREIVAELEKQFSRLDEAVANLQRVKANLKRYKASVLKDAVEGRLVPTEAELARREGRRFETGEQLLQRILEKRRDQWSRSGAYKTPLNRSNEKPGELPEGWVWSTYEQLGRMQLGRQRSPKYHNGPNMRPYLRVQNVFEDRIDLSDVMEMEFNASDFEKYQLATGDLLLNEGQSPELLGRPAIYRGELPGACFTNTLIRFRAAEGVSVEFALHLSRHYMLAGRFVDEGTITTNIAHLSLGRLATVEFPLPPFAEQKRIVEEVERRLSLVRSVQTEVDANLKRAQALRQSVLSKSFVSP